MFGMLLLIGLYFLFGMLLYLTRKRNIEPRVHDIIIEELDGEEKNKYQNDKWLI
jgi:hypothetical protein